MRKKIAIYGAGGLGREIAFMVKELYNADLAGEPIGFFDDGKPLNQVIDGLPVLGGLDEINRNGDQFHLLMAIADPATKRKLVEQIGKPGIEYPSVIHPTCLRGDSNNIIGEGTILTAGVILTTNITLGDFVLVNLATTIGHDVHIGSYSTIMPGCSISGNVELGEGCLMGTGARTLQNIKVGNNSIIGAGAVVTKSFGHNVKLIGVPALVVTSH